jgi:hypothetical protein
MLQAHPEWPMVNGTTWQLAISHVPFPIGPLFVRQPSGEAGQKAWRLAV